MAGAAARLIARRTALLLRCQQAREDRRRAAAVRTVRLRTAAAAEVGRAQEALGAHEAARADTVRRAYDDMARRQVDVTALRALPDIERPLRQRAAALTAEVAAAQQALATAEAAEQVARRELAQAAWATLRRERLARAAMDRYRRVLADMEEMDREDQAADGWKAA